MEKNMRNAVFSCLCLTALLLGGCSVSSTNPASSLAASDPLPEILAGTWQIEEILGGPPSQPTSLTLLMNTDGSVAVKLVEGNQEQQEVASLANLSGSLVLSVASEAGSWTLVSLQHDTASGTLTIRQLDAATVKSDIQSGAIAGEASDFGGGEILLRITASTPDLRAYLQSKPGIFEEPLAVLKAQDLVP
jgi:hypothetical protein